MEQGVESLASYNIYQHFLPQLFLVWKDISLPTCHCLIFAHPYLLGNLRDSKNTYSTQTKYTCVTGKPQQIQCQQFELEHKFTCTSHSNDEQLQSVLTVTKQFWFDTDRHCSITLYVDVVYICTMRCAHKLKGARIKTTTTSYISEQFMPEMPWYSYYNTELTRWQTLPPATCTYVCRHVHM